MIFTVIGSGTAVPSHSRGSPCCHLAVDGQHVVFDLGSGSVRQLWRNGVDIRRLDALVISHFHPDHTADLVPLLFALRNPEFALAGSLTMLGPHGLEALLGGLQELYGDWIRPPDLELQIRELERETIQFDRWSLTAVPTGHTPESLAFRIEDESGTTVVYGGDSPFSEDLVLLSRGADLLVLECSFPEGEPHPGHLTPSEAAAIAAGAGARRLLLTHFYPEADGADLRTPAARIFNGEIIIASDGMKLNV